MAAAPDPVVIDIAGGDQLLNAAAVAALLGIGLSTLEGYEYRRAQYAHPLPEPEADPIGLLIPDTELAADVRKLWRVSARRREMPKVYRRSAVEDWDARRARGRQS